MIQVILSLLKLPGDKRAVTTLECGLIEAVIAGVTAVAFTGAGALLTAGNVAL